MKTLSVTAARQNLGHWLKRAADGEDIGVLIDGRVVALRLVEVHSDDYATVEYRATSEELDAFASKIHAELVSDRKAGRLTRFSGKLSRGRARRSA